MRETVRDRERLEHILEAIDIILTYTVGKSKEELTSDKIRFYGLVKNIEIVSHPDTPWDKIMKMRHVLIHDYYMIDEDTVYYVIEDDLQPLREQVTRYLADTDWEEWEKNEVVIQESTAYKTLMQTAQRMKKDGLPIKQISRYTGLTAEEIEGL